MTIERGTEYNIAELESLYNDLNDYLASTVNYPGWIKHIYPIKETASEAIKDDSLFIAKENDVITGSVILNHKPEEAYNQVKWIIDTDYENVLVIHTLVVHPLFLRKNTGTLLMEFAKQYGLDNNLKSIRLDVSVNNLPAIKLYEKMGYKYTGTVDLGLPYEHLKWFRLYELLL